MFKIKLPKVTKKTSKTATQRTLSKGVRKLSNYQNPSSIPKPMKRDKKEKIIRQQIKEKSKQRRGFSYFSKIVKRLKTPKIIISIIITTVVLSVLAYFLFIQKDLFIHTISTSGNFHVSDLEISNITSKYKDKSFFLVIPDTVEKEILAISPFIKSVHVEKILPDELQIIILEREPYYLYVNRSGIYLVSKDDIVIEVLAEWETIPLTKEDLDILSSTATLSSIELPEEKELEDLEKLYEDALDNEPSDEEEVIGIEEEIKALSEQIEKTKKATFEKDRNDLEAKLFLKWDEMFKSLDQEFQTSQIKLYSYDDEVFNELDVIPIKSSSFFSSASDISQIKSMGDFQGFVYISKIRLDLMFGGNKRIIINPTMENSNLYEDLSAIIGDIKKRGESFSQIDTRGDKIVVK